MSLHCTVSEWTLVADSLPDSPESPWNGERWMLLAYSPRHGYDTQQIEVTSEMGGYNIICNPHKEDRVPGPIAWRLVRPPRPGSA